VSVLALKGRSSRLLLVLLGFALSLAPRGGSAQAPPGTWDSTLFQAMQWRSIGPFRGGRVTTVAGVPSQILTYYMGATGGGVWKTEDGGASWKNISDGFLKTGSVGAIAVAPSDPNVLFVGMGEAPVRGVASSYGDGVYRSTDAGRNWTKVGLDSTRQISKVVIHPTNPDVVFVAAQGSRWMPTAERGIYRTADGGKSWKLVLHVDKNSGASDLSMDPTNPRILYAAFWDHQRTPWMVRSGGPGSGIWKSTDGGETWTRLKEGLPKLMGKIGVAVSPASPDRVYAIIEADEGGLFRSDDAGKTWRRMSEDRILRARAWYYTHITADPLIADVVYVMNAPLLKSIDGGRTFNDVDTPHGDNHALWINPRNTRYMINGNDGGANISYNGGRSWSTQANQPTAQIYRVNADERFPYRLYGGQQDNSSVIIASRTTGFGIDREDWMAGPGCESAYLDFLDPREARYVFGGCYQGIIEELDTETGYRRNVMAYPALGLAEPSSEQKYRFNWNAPIVASRHDPKVLYHAGNVLFKSSDRGQTWTAISPDLTRNDKQKQGQGGGPITNEGAGGEVYNTIFYVAESPHEAGTIWVGTDDGIVQLTRDGGKTWSNVTPKGPGEALVNSIEVSRFDPATAYAVITRYKWNDNTPHIFRTTDYGKSWREIAGGLPQGHLARVVREDPVRRGLLYAGTETGLFASFDGGARWQQLQLNLPVVPITDLKMHHGDLVASTEGRAFWILDDVTPLHQATDQIAKTDVFLYKPRDVHRIEGFTGDAPGVGKNPPNGAVVYYHLAATPDSTTVVTVEFLDDAGKVMRTLSSEKKKPVEAPGARAPTPLAPKAGMNRAVWDLRVESVPRVPGLFLLSSSGAGYRVAPGRYQVRLTVGKKALTQSFAVLGDPRLQIADADFRAQQELVSTIHGRVRDVLESVTLLRDVREQVTKLVALTKDQPNGKAISDAGKALTARVDTVEGALVQPKQKTFQDVINFRNGLDAHYLFLAEAADEMMPPVTSSMTERLKELDADWEKRRQQVASLLDRDLPAFNALFKDSGVPAVIIKRREPIVSAGTVVP
jgi:photosystem II stability/assembly factor-like uncharacterized protein